MDNDALDSVDQLEGLIAILDGLRGLAPAAIQDSVGCRDACRRGGILAAHDSGQDLDRGPRVTSRQRADFGERFWHLRFVVPAGSPLVAAKPLRTGRSRDMT
jgi:hypothetical protein